MTRFTFGAWIGLTFAFAFAATWPFRGDWAQSVANSTMQRPLAHAKTWRVQLSPIDMGEFVSDRSDLIVIDTVKDNAAPYGISPPTPAGVARLKVRSDGARRLVLARLSIGETVASSPTWSDAWTAQPPEWMGEQHCTRPLVRRVRYWQQEWKNILFRAPGSHMERIIAAGFDGVVVGGVDVFRSFEAGRPSARREMIENLRELAASARAMKPGFIVIAQNAEALLSDPDYRMVIDGLAIESLLYAVDASGVRNRPIEIRQSMQLLRRLQKEGKPIFAVEYLRSARLVDQAALELRRRGFVPSFDTRRDDSAADLGEPACPPGTVW